MTKPETRVGAVISANLETQTVRFAGYGTYKGDEVPPKGIIIMGIDLHEIGHTNPRIDLDNGHTIWGCQCWWAPEIVIMHKIKLYEQNGFVVEIVDPCEYGQKSEVPA